MSSSYVVLARKHRPQTFEDVVGQNAVSQTLLNAVESGRVAHAYVFSGPRGVGKTTTARILAKCLNCVKGPTKNPCNQCNSCVSISQSNSIDDVLEIDGASNRGIEQIRELRESAKYAPAHSRYRIYIIDEAHQITKDAFGALLKTLEEPPPHVVFMLATTEVQKIPAPILSRCQRFSLRPISAELVLKHLKEICGQEKITVADEALADIVRFVEGSLRDALSLLDQAAVFAPTGITSNTIRDLLGLLPLEMIQGFAQTARMGFPSAILKSVNEAVQNGVDLTQLGKDLQNYYHNLLLAKAGVEDAFKVDSQKRAQEAANFDFQTLERNIRLLSQALEDMRHSETPRAIFEIYALRLGQKTVDARELIERLEKLEGKQNVSIPAKQFSKEQFPSPKGEGPGVGLPPSGSPPPSLPPSGGGTSLGSAEVLSSWPELVNEIAQTKASLASALESAKISFDAGRLILTFDKTFNQEMVARSLEFVKENFVRRFGATVPFELKVEKSAAPVESASVEKASLRQTASRPTPLEESNALEEVTASEFTSDIQKALKHFPGAVKREKKT